MGNGYNNELQNVYQKNNFFPMLCRLSIKDVSIATYKDHSSSVLANSSSPEVSCIGKVKMNNRVLSFPSTNFKLNTNYTSTNSTLTHHHRQHHVKTTKLNKKISSKNLIDTSPSEMIKNGKSSRSRSCTSINRNKEMMMLRRGVIAGGKMVCKNGDDECKNGVFVELNIDKLDPPLPVVKKVQQSGELDDVNLWQRRGFVEVKSLQIKSIHLLNTE